MTDSFDLTTQPWIPVETLEGRFLELSTRDVLRDAHQLRGLADASPLVCAMLTRHLLAILHRTYDGPKSMREWSVIVGAKRFDERAVNRYLDSVADRMDLFHPTQPFGQARGLIKSFGRPQDITPIHELEVEWSAWGVGQTLFRHRSDEDGGMMPPSRAARALLAHQGFATGGLVKKPNEPISATGAPFVGAAVVVLRGESLFGTLVSNLLHYDPEHARPVPLGAETDACAWEQGVPPPTLPLLQEPKVRPRGYLDMLTWLSRRIELVGGVHGVGGFIRAVYKGVEEGSPRDPMVTYARDDKRGWRAITVDPVRAFWRSANALFETNRGDTARFVRPAAIALVTDPDALSLLGASRMYTVEVAGVSAFQSRVDSVQGDRVSAVARVFADPDARTAVDEALGVAEVAVKALRGAVFIFAKRALSAGDRDPDTKDVSSLAKSFGAEASAWSALGVEFDVFLRGLGEDADAALALFATRARAVAVDVFLLVTDRPDSTGRWLKARALAERTLRQGLKETYVAAEGAAEEARS